MRAAPTDFNDLAAESGLEAVREIVQAAAAPVPPPPRFKLTTVSELRDMPRLQWAIHSVLPAAGVACLFGASGTGKSFLALDMAAYLAMGERWFGNRVRRSNVIYAALEGEAGFRGRVEAWERDHEREFPDEVRFLFQSFNLASRADVVDLAAAIDAAGGAAVIFIDTLNRAAPESDENSSQDMGRIIERVKQLQAMTGGLVVLVHHTGKDLTKGMRGHSSLFAALDAAIEVSRLEDRREWKVAKAKDGEDGALHVFRLERVNLGSDDDGEAITSCVVRLPADGEIVDKARALRPKGGNQLIVYNALGALFRESEAFGCAGAPAVRPCLLMKDAIDKTKGRLTCDPARRAERASAAITGLVARGVLDSNEGWIWLK
jgi:putative DNA primase/helicase